MPDASEPEYLSRNQHSKDVPYWVENIDDKITPEVRKLLEEYSNIPADEVKSHIYDIREKAWAIRSYPCTGIGIWLGATINKSPDYAEILNCLRSGQTFVNIGCYIGQDERRLAWDGAPSDQMVSVDIVSHWDIGYEMFNDKDRFKAKFIEDDALKPGPGLKALNGKIDIIWAAAVFHQWGLETQVTCLKNLMALTRAGSMIAGYQVGFLKGGVKTPGGGPESFYLHDPETWRQLWQRVGLETGTRWESKAELRRFADVGWSEKDTAYLGEDARYLSWTVRRQERAT